MLLSKGKKAALNQLGNNNFVSYYAQRGITLEPEAIELYERIYDCKVSLAGFITNSDFPEAGFSPDGYIPDRPIQVKCFKGPKHLKLVEYGLDPLELFDTYCQVQFEMMIYDSMFDDLVLYNPEVDSLKAFHVISVERNEAVITRFKEKLA